MKTNTSILLIFLLILSAAQAQKTIPLPDYIKNVTVYDINEKPTSFAQILETNPEKIIYIDYWASWCKPCRKEIPFSKKLQQQLKDKPIVFLYLSTDEVHEEWTKALKEIKTDGLHYRLDKNSKPILQKEYKIKGIPFYQIIDKKGNLYKNNAKRPSDKKIIDDLNKAIKDSE